MVSRNGNTIFQRAITLILDTSEISRFFIEATRPNNISLLSFLIKKSCRITVSNRKIIIGRDFRPVRHNGEV